MAAAFAVLFRRTTTVTEARRPTATGKEAGKRERWRRKKRKLLSLLPFCLIYHYRHRRRVAGNSPECYFVVIVSGAGEEWSGGASASYSPGAGRADETVSARTAESSGTRPIIRRVPSNFNENRRPNRLSLSPYLFFSF